MAKGSNRLDEGMVKKGGKNPPPKTSRPPRPQGQAVGQPTPRQAVREPNPPKTPSQ